MQTGRISDKLSLAFSVEEGKQRRQKSKFAIEQIYGRCFKNSFGKTWHEFQNSNYFSGDEQVSTETGQFLDNSRGEEGNSYTCDGLPNGDKVHRRHVENEAKWNTRPGIGILFNKGNLR